MPLANFSRADVPTPWQRRAKIARCISNVIERDPRSFDDTARDVEMRAERAKLSQELFG
jgi:hypothetical protein